MAIPIREKLEYVFSNLMDFLFIAIKPSGQYINENIISAILKMK